MMRHGGMDPSVLRRAPLWEIAAALGIHRIETYEERDNREIVEVKAEYWEETGQARREHMARVAARRRERKGAGKR
jgi:hypothetical protein